MKQKTDEHVSHRVHQSIEPTTRIPPVIDESNDLSSLLLSQTNDGRIKINNIEEDTNARCKFNGYSNKEIAIMILIACLTNILFFFQYGDMIYMVNVLLSYVFA